MAERINNKTVSAILEIAQGADVLTPRPSAKMCASALQDFRESLIDDRLKFDRGAQTTLAIELALKWLIEEGMRREMKTGASS